MIQYQILTCFAWCFSWPLLSKATCEETFLHSLFTLTPTTGNLNMKPYSSCFFPTSAFSKWKYCSQSLKHPSTSFKHPPTSLNIPQQKHSLNFSHQQLSTSFRLPLLLRIAYEWKATWNKVGISAGIIIQHNSYGVNLLPCITIC